MASSSTTLVLKCNICPKHPSFSDVSHLLTHVSSKGHLSCYFKLQVRSNQEPEAAKLLADYDTWYQDQNLAVLLAERMRAKRSRREKIDNDFINKRNPALSLSSSVVDTTSEVKIKVEAVDAPAAPGLAPAVHPSTTPKTAPSLLPYLDPRLSYVYLGTPPDLPHGLADDIPALADASSVVQSTADFTEPQTQPQTQTQTQNCSVYPEQMCQPPTQIQITETPGSKGSRSSPLINAKRVVANRPSRRSQRARKLAGGNGKMVHHHGPSTPCGAMDDPFVDDSSYADSVFGEEELKQVKLKGILWPGMDIFDSATEAMRKKRNQKKDDSVLRKMEMTSKTIEPTEQVFSPRGTLQVERVITGNPDDYSPIKGETPVPPPSKKRSVRVKRPLSKSDGNLYNLRNRVRKGAKGSASGSGSGANKARASLEEISRQALPLLESENSPLAVNQLEDSFSDDFNMSYAAASAGKRQKPDFDIYQEDREEEEDQDQQENDSSRISHHKAYLGNFAAVRAFHHTHNTNPLSTYPYTFHKPYALHRSSTMPECSTTTNKENIDPYGNASDYPFFFPPGSQMNFGFLHESNPFGHGRNPLSCSSYIPNIQDDMLVKSGLKYTTIEPSRVKREMTPSEATLADMDKEDFANVLHGF